MLPPLQLPQVSRPAGFTSWCIEKPFKGPEAYKVLRFLVQDQRFEENYKAYAAMEETLVVSEIGEQ